MRTGIDLLRDARRELRSVCDCDWCERCKLRHEIADYLKAAEPMRPRIQLVP